MANIKNPDKIPQVLIADDETDLRDLLKSALSRFNLAITTAKNGDEALYYLRRQHFDLVVSDHKMPGANGMDVLNVAREMKPNPPLFILITGRGTIELAVEAMKAGAYDFISKPFEIEEFVTHIEKALNTLELQNENRTLRHVVESHYVFSEIIGVSKSLRHVIDLAQRAAEQNSPVLILGESGTGKDLFARAIHYHGNRQKKHFIAINCGAIPENLIESEFFGHKRGAFTGAISDRKGCFEEADGGTVMLDEIGEMPFDLQVKLLRVLEARKIRRLGENLERPVDFRIIAATNRPLQQEIQRNRFREDLYYRLNVFSITIPQLRERLEDVVPLAEHFLKQAQKEMNTHVVSISPSALEIMQLYSFPGNIRELFNILQRAILLCDGEVIEPQHLPHEVKAIALTHKSNTSVIAGAKAPFHFEFSQPSGWNLKDEIQKMQESLEQFLIRKALEETGRNYKRAAELLGISRASLYNKMQRPGAADE